MREKIQGDAGEEKANRIWQFLLRGIVTASFIVCVLFIWNNSLQTAEVSAGHSGRVTETVNMVLKSLGQGSVTEHFVRKLAHFSEYGLEGLLAALLFLVYCFEAGRWLWRMVLTGLVTAVIDESLQFFSAGRSPGALDVGIDMAGFICGMLFLFALHYIFQICRNLRNICHE